jgi:hypothetical protein
MIDTVYNVDSETEKSIVSRFPFFLLTIVIKLSDDDDDVFIDDTEKEEKKKVSTDAVDCL